MSGSAFISYGHAPEDQRISQWIADTLRAGGLNVWRDDALQARGGADLNQEIASALSASACVVFVQSAISLSSRYCQAELVYAMELGKPILRVEMEAVALGAVPPALLPLLGEVRAIAKFHNAAPETWLGVLAEAAARVGIDLRSANIDTTLLSPYAHIVRPNYLRLREGDAQSWQAVQARLIEAQAIAPANGYTALSLSLLRTFLGEGAAALADAETALRNLPMVPDAYYAAALAACVSQRADRRAKPEVDAILNRLETARSLPGAGAHVWLLGAMVTDGFYIRRYLTPPMRVDAWLEDGLAKGVLNGEECQRAWDMEGKMLERSHWAPVARAFSFSV